MHHERGALLQLMETSSEFGKGSIIRQVLGHFKLVQDILQGSEKQLHDRSVELQDSIKAAKGKEYQLGKYLLANPAKTKRVLGEVLTELKISKQKLTAAYEKTKLAAVEELAADVHDMVVDIVDFAATNVPRLCLRIKEMETLISQATLLCAQGRKEVAALQKAKEEAAAKRKRQLEEETAKKKKRRKKLRTRTRTTLANTMSSPLTPKSKSFVGQKGSWSSKRHRRLPTAGCASATLTSSKRDG
jgi:hypothetical protein